MSRFLSFTINISGPLNIKIIQYKNIRVSHGQAFTSGNKFLAMHDGIDKIDVDDETIGGEFD